MEGWHTTGTALFPLLKRIAPPSGTVSAKVANLQYPSRWDVHLDLRAYKLREELPYLRGVSVSKTTEAQCFDRSAYQHDRIRGKRLLQRLKEIDPTIWRYLRPKHEVEDRFKMRLLKADGHESRRDLNGIFNTNDASSYIALSYCWHYPTWTPNPDLTRSSTISSYLKPFAPITAPMWQAFLAERQNPDEAIWVDQGCIHQANSNAKMDAVNSMDIVFGGARKVVIALEDVLLTPQDAEALLQYYHAIQSISGRQRLLVWTDWLQFLDRKEDLAVACLKIFRARWFRRAWCSHEFLTARSHVFLVPVVTAPSAQVKPRDSVNILNFNANFLLALLLARTDWIVSQDRGELANIIIRHETALTDGKTNSSRAMNTFLSQNVIMVGFTQGLIEALLKYETSGSRKPYLGTLGDVLSLESSSAVDKLAITLNVLKTGLSYQGPSDLSETDVSLIATLIAFAANDASALASSGSFLQAKDLNISTYNSIESDRSCHCDSVSPQPQFASGETRNPIGWATLPQVDTYSRLGSERVETPVNAAMTQGGLKLELSFVACSNSVRTPNEKFLAFAQTLLRWYQGQAGPSRRFDRHVSDEDVVLAEFRAFSLESDQVHQALTGIDRSELTQALACLLELGGWWPAAYGRHIKPSSFNHATDEVNEDSTLQNALSWVQSLLLRSMAGNPQMAEFGSDKACENHLPRLLRYASDVVRTGAGERSEFVKKQSNPDFAFQLCKIRDVTSETTSEVDTIIFAPSKRCPSYELAIPLALTTHDFPVDMNRVWILEKMATGDMSISGSQSKEYLLRGKTRFVGCTVPDGQVRQVIISG